MKLPPNYSKCPDGLYRRVVYFDTPKRGVVSPTILVRNSDGKLLWSEKTWNCVRLAKGASA